MWLLDNLGTQGKKLINIQGKSYQEEGLISEGGYAFIYRVTDITTQKQYALKKMICQSKDSIKVARNEYTILSQFKNHPNIINLFGVQEEQSQGAVNVHMLLELAQCSIIDILEQKLQGLDLPQIFEITRDVCYALKSMHEQGIQHRDIKIENILKINQKFKLCDFGSCSTDTYDLSKINSSKLLEIEEQIEKSTTLMYRPPELADVYSQKKVSTKVDIWMLGCVVFTLAFCKHPFQDNSKLAIVNAQFRFPQESNGKLNDFIRLMLNPIPDDRPNNHTKPQDKQHCPQVLYSSNKAKVKQLWLKKQNLLKTFQKKNFNVKLSRQDSKCNVVPIKAPPKQNVAQKPVFQTQKNEQQAPLFNQGNFQNLFEGQQNNIQFPNTSQNQAQDI